MTMIELLVVVIITGILATVGVVNLIGQTGKAREAEAKMQLNAIGRAQQAYFFENQSFADQMIKLDVQVTGKYYTFPNQTLVLSVFVKHDAVPIDAAGNNTRHYELCVYFNSNQTFSTNLCQSLTPLTLAAVEDSPTEDCLTGLKLE
jgi:type II secretory pathway pseudopilin PulG